MTVLIESLKARWTRDGLKLRPGVSPEALAAFEARYRVVLPPAFRSYFEAVDGTGDEMVGEWCFRFWPLDAVLPIEVEFLPDRVNPDWNGHWFLFADHLIESFHFAVRLTADPTEEGPIAVPNGLELWPLAPSFEAFLTLYLADEDNLFNFGPPVEA